MRVNLIVCTFELHIHYDLALVSHLNMDDIVGCTMFYDLFPRQSYPLFENIILELVQQKQPSLGFTNIVPSFNLFKCFE